VIRLSYTELLALRDEAVTITKTARNAVARAAAYRIIAQLDGLLERRKSQVADELAGQ
jgi:hypothetical protein